VGRNKANLSGPAGLACAILDRAARDVANGGSYAQDARAFLLGPWARELLGALCDALALGDGYDGDDLRKLAGLGEGREN